MGKLIKVHLQSQYSNKLLSTRQQERYQSGIWSLIYIVKHYCPELKIKLENYLKEWTMTINNDTKYSKCPELN